MKKLEHILCPVDFSEISRQAFDRAVAIARADGASLTALHVLATPNATAIVPYVGPEALAPFPLPEVDVERITQQMRSFLALNPPPFDVPCLVTEAADIHHEILDRARQLHADLIVIGTHGRSGFHRLILGSVTEKVLRKAPIPVMTVPPAAPDVVPAGREPFRRVLCALDFSECSMLGLQFAIEFAKQHNARLGVLTVVEFAPVGYDPYVGPETDLGALQSAAEVVIRDRLHGVVAAADRMAMDIEEMVVTGKAHRDVVRMANDWGADLIVLGIHGRTAVGRAFFGSTVVPVVRHAACPVLTVRTAAHASTAAA